MPWNLPTLLTWLRILLVPVLVLVYYLGGRWANELAVTVFIVAGLTDWLDGWLARRRQQLSPFGAFLDPVADKLMVATALVVLVEVNPSVLLALASAVIIGREISISALREWMAELGQRALIAVHFIAKLKTVMQMVAIGCMLYGGRIGGLDIFDLGLALLIAAAILTVWTMVVYLRAAWPVLKL